MNKEMEVSLGEVLAVPGAPEALVAEIVGLMRAEGPADNPEYDKRAWARADTAQYILVSWSREVYKRQRLATIEEELAKHTDLEGTLEALRQNATYLFGPELLVVQRLKAALRVAAEEMEEQIAEEYEEEMEQQLIKEYEASL